MESVGVEMENTLAGALSPVGQEEPGPTGAQGPDSSLPIPGEGVMRDV